MSQARLPLWFLVVNWVIVCCAFVLGVVLGRRTPLPDPQATALRLVYEEIERSYVDRIDGRELLDRAIAAMARLDDYSRYVPEADVPRFVEETTGTYEGIGVVMQYGEDAIHVGFPIGDGPGDRAGLLPGDRVVAIDGTRVDALTREARSRLAQERLRGPKGSRVALTVLRDGAEKEFAIERGPVQKASVKWTRWLDEANGIAYVHVADFHPGVQKALQQELAKLAQKGTALRGLVLDLRFDLGGNLDEAIALARMFVKEGNLVSLRRRDSEVVERHDADPAKCTYPDLPIALLVNRSSASASEVLAGALQDHGRAVVVGEPTYGKGVVNTIYQWHEQPFRLKLTTARYFTPKGRNLDRGRHRAAAAGEAKTEPEGGIAPDLVQALDEKAQAAVQDALAEFPPPTHHEERVRTFYASRNERAPGALAPEQDAQLEAALQALRKRATGG